MSKFFLSFFLIHLPFCLGRADTEVVQVFLENGDALTGRLVDETEAELVLLVDYLGEISLDQRLVAKVVGNESAAEAAQPSKPARAAVATDASPLSKQSGVKSRAVVAAALTEKGSEDAEETDPDGRESNMFTSVFRALEEGLNIMPQWDKRLEFGLDKNSGRRDQSSSNYRLNMQRRGQGVRVNLNAEYDYKSANGSATRDRLSSDYRWRRDISPGVFYESRSSYYSDSIKRIDSNIEQKLGLGRRLVDGNVASLSAGLGVSGRWREVTREEDGEVDYLVDLSQDWDYRMSERIRLRQDFKVAMPLEDSEAYEIIFSASMTSDVTKAINLSLRYQLEFDNSLSKDRRSDRRFISSLGYVF